MIQPPDAEPAASPPAPPADPAALPVEPVRLREPLLAAAITTAVVTAISYLAPESWAATGVGVAFLASTWWLVLRHDELTVRAYGLSLGGLLEPVPIDLRRITRATLTATAWALLLMAIAFPLFALGYRYLPEAATQLHLPDWLARMLPLYRLTHARFVFRAPPSIFSEIAGQLVVIALPEEAFFRGYLHTSFDKIWPPRWRILGADLGPGWLLAAAIFAVGHVLTIRHPARLAVFFPALVFGWLRKRTGGIGASVLFHASCNLYSATLGRGFGLL